MNNEVLIPQWKVVLACWLSGALIGVGIIFIFEEHYLSAVWNIVLGIVGFYAFLTTK